MLENSLPNLAINVPASAPVSEQPYDSLTKLLTRHSFCQQIQQYLSSPTKIFYLLLLELDHFKSVNDACGLAIGDIVLIRTARRIQAVVGEQGIVSRTSGDEFAIALLVESEEQVKCVAEQLLDRLRRPFVVSGQVISLSASMGIATISAGHGNAENLFCAASIALHHAEIAGKDQHVWFTPSMLNQVRLRRSMENELRSALALQQAELRQGMALEQFDIYYQPQIELVSRRLKGFEALLRWHNPSRGWIPPSEFIPLAEEIGVIHLLSEWMIAKACREAVHWKMAGQQPAPQLAVNISPLQLHQGHVLMKSLRHALETSGLPARQLQLEITESALIDDVDDILQQIKSLGISLVLDDFGTGYSSLSQLIHYPFDKVKIDKSFIHALTQPVSHSDQKRQKQYVDPQNMIRAIAVLGSSLGIETIAEGVETVEEATKVRLAGVNEIQGFWVSPAVTAEQIPALLNRYSLV